MNNGNCPPLPVPPPTWSFSADDIAQTTSDALKAHEEGLNKIAALKPEECNFESVLRAMANIDLSSEIKLNPVDFMQYVSTDKAVRDAAVGSSKSQDYGIGAGMRMDVFESLKHAEKNTDVSKLTAEEKRFLEKELLDRKRAGLDLPEDKRETLMAKKKEISELCIEFNKNCNEENGKLEFTAEELEGVSADVLEGFPKSTNSEGKEVYSMSFKTPDVIPVLDYAKRQETRKRASQGYENRSAQNAPIFEKIIELRQDCAALLGYKNWAQYKLETKMAKDDKTVLDFLADLKEKVTVLGKEETRAFMALKEQEAKEQGIPFDNSFRHWDYRYYSRLSEEKDLDLDNELVKKYFPVEKVIKEVLNIYQELLSLKFFKIEGAKLWHNEASQWAVFDSEKVDQGTEGFLGYMHLE